MLNAHIPQAECIPKACMQSNKLREVLLKAVWVDPVGKKHRGTRPGQKDRWVLSKNFKGEEVFFLTKWFLEVPCHISSSSSSSSYHYIYVEDHAIIHIHTHLQSYRLYRSQYYISIYIYTYITYISRVPIDGNVAHFRSANHSPRTRRNWARVARP